MKETKKRAAAPVGVGDRQDADATKTPWWKNTGILASASALIAGVAGSIFGTDIGAENVNDVVFGGAAVIGGSVLVAKGGKAIWLIVQAKRGGGQ